MTPKHSLRNWVCIQQYILQTSSDSRLAMPRTTFEPLYEISVLTALLWSCSLYLQLCSGPRSVNLHHYFQSELSRPIPWNQTADVHRRSTFIMWHLGYITWCWHHRNHANTITSVIAAKQTVINKVNVFSIKYHYSDILLKKHKLHLFCW